MSFKYEGEVIKIIIENPSIIKQEGIVSDFFTHSLTKDVFHKIKERHENNILVDYDILNEVLGFEYMEFIEKLKSKKLDKEHTLYVNKLREDYVLYKIQNGLNDMISKSTDVMDINGLYKDLQDLYNDITNAMDLSLDKIPVSLMKPSHYKDEFKGFKGLIGHSFPSFPTLSNHLRIVPGTIWVVTGTPGHGKSTFLQILIGETIKRLKWSVFSPEPDIGEQFTCIMSQQHKRDVTLDAKSMVHTLDENLTIIDTGYNSCTVKKLMDNMEKCRKTYNTDVFLIDPWNNLEEDPHKWESQHQYIGRMLRYLRWYAKKRKVTIIIVAHPRKGETVYQKKGTFDDQIPTLKSIDGSSHWNNNPDLGVVVFKDNEFNTMNVIIEKCRHIGRIGNPGTVYLRYENMVAHELPGTFSNVVQAKHQKNQNKKSYRKDVSNGLPDFNQ